MEKKYFYILFSVFLILFSYKVCGQGDEEKLKAAFLEKFARYTDWNSHDIKTSADAPFVIGVYNDEEFAKILKKLYKDRKIKNRNVKIKIISDYRSDFDCQLLYIGDTSIWAVKEIISRVADRKILTVGNTEGYKDEGVHINMFLTEQGTMHFQINREAVEKSGLKMSLLLLEVAK